MASAAQLPRVLVTGASGLLGRAVLAELHANAQPWCNAVGIALSRCADNLQSCDLTDHSSVAALLLEHRPCAIVHCAAERRPDVVDHQPGVAAAININATKSLCSLAASDCPILFVSTDYVFDGTSPPYTEESAPSPLNAYGQSKLAGERIVMAASSANCVLRVPVLYGDVKFLGESAITTLFPKVKSLERCVMSHYERRFPTHCADVAIVIREMLDRKLRASDVLMSGIFHWSGTEEMTKYDMALTMAESFRLPTDHIVSDPNPSAGGATRPFNSRLSCAKLQLLGIGQTAGRSFATGIRDCLETYSR